MLPFERIGEPSVVGRKFEGLLYDVLAKSGRFNMKRVLGPESGNLDDLENAARIREKINVNYALVGSVVEHAGTLEIFAQIIEIGSSQIITAENVYGEHVDVDRNELIKLCKGLSIKLRDALPVIEKTVVQAAGKKVLLDLGKESLIKKGMRCILFKDGKPIVNPQTGKELGIRAVKLAYVVIIEVHEEYCEAEIKEVLADGIAASHKVITQ